MYKNNAQTISKAVEKMKNNTLLVEEVLDEEDLINDLKSPSFSQLISFLTTEKMEKLLDYILKEPAKDADKKTGHRYPYYACEVLCSENVFLLEKYFEDASQESEKVEEDFKIFERRSPNKTKDEELEKGDEKSEEKKEKEKEDVTVRNKKKEETVESTTNEEKQKS